MVTTRSHADRPGRLVNQAVDKGKGVALELHVPVEDEEE